MAPRRDYSFPVISASSIAVYMKYYVNLLVPIVDHHLVKGIVTEHRKKIW